MEIRTGIFPTLPPLRNREQAVDLAGFFDLLQTAFDLYIKTTGAPEGVTPQFVESFTQKRTGQADQPFDLITYKISSSVPAASKNDGSTPRGLTLRENKQSQNKNDYNLLIYGWKEQVIVTFEIWSTSNSNANKLAIWFHKFIYTVAFIFKMFEGRGISNFDFVGRLEDTAPRTDEQELYLRQLCYTFRLETLVAFEERQLTSITLQLDSQGTAPINLTDSTK